jgi:ribosomal-protein-alanine N-acetyltransferase
MSFADLTLRTGRLDLRPLVDADADAFFALRSDPVVQRYGSGVWTDLQQAHTRIADNQRDMAAGQLVELAIVRREDASLLGTCTLFHHDAACRRAEIGYALMVPAWGRGYASEAATALLDWGFAHMGLNRVEADIDPRNAGSARVLERLGFALEGRLRERWIVAGEKSDSAIYGLLAAEWRAAHR